MNKRNILVTGISGDLGQAVVKCLRLSSNPVSIVGSDIIPDVGAVFADSIVSIPRADDAAYLGRIEAICSTHAIDAIIPASEPEIFTLSRAKAEGTLNVSAVLVCQPFQWLEIFGDKLSCFKALAGKVPLAEFGDGQESSIIRRFIEENRFPCIVKSRRSWGSKSVRPVYKAEELEKQVMQTPMPLVQEFIDDSEGEYSVGVFSCENFTKAVAFKRNLGPVGASWYADNHNQDENVIRYCLKIAKATGLQGSCNIQVRKGVQGVRLLEINPRFSSLIAARAACGFKDLEWSLGLAFGEKVEAPRGEYKSIRFQRFFHELIDDGSGYMALSQWLPRAG